MSNSKIKAQTLSKTRVLITPQSAKDLITLFSHPDGAIEACVTSFEGDVMRFKIAPPDKDQFIAITRNVDNSVEFEYRNVP